MIFNAWSATQSATGIRIAVAVSLEWFHAAVPTPFVAKLRKPPLATVRVSFFLSFFVLICATDTEHHDFHAFCVLIESVSYDFTR